MGRAPRQNSILDNKWLTLVTSRAGNPHQGRGKEAGGKEASNKWGAHPGKNAFPDNKWGAHPGKTAFLDNKYVTLVTSRAGNPTWPLGDHWDHCWQSWGITVNSDALVTLRAGNPTRAGGKEAGGKEAGGKEACNKWVLTHC